MCINILHKYIVYFYPKPPCFTRLGLFFIVPFSSSSVKLDVTRWFFDMKNISLAVTQVLRFGSKRKFVKLTINSNFIPYKLYWVKVCYTRHHSIRVYVQFQLTLYNGIWVELFHHRNITFMYHLLSAVLDITLAGIIRYILPGKCETSCSTLLIHPTFIYAKTLYTIREQPFVQTVRVYK